MDLIPQIKQLLQTKAQERELDSSTFSALLNDDFFVSTRRTTDDINYLFLKTTQNGPAAYLWNGFTLKHLQLYFPLAQSMLRFHSDTLLEGVLQDSTNPPKFLVLDLIAIQGVKITQRSFNTRLGVCFYI